MTWLTSALLAVCAKIALAALADRFVAAAAGALWSAVGSRGALDALVWIVRTGPAAGGYLAGGAWAAWAGGMGLGLSRVATVWAVMTVADVLLAVVLGSHPAPGVWLFVEYAGLLVPAAVGVWLGSRITARRPSAGVRAAVPVALAVAALVIVVAADVPRRIAARRAAVATEVPIYPGGRLLRSEKEIGARRVLIGLSEEPDAAKVRQFYATVLELGGWVSKAPAACGVDPHLSARGAACWQHPQSNISFGVLPLAPGPWSATPALLIVVAPTVAAQSER
jgi:hypothetical protein